MYQLSDSSDDSWPSSSDDSSSSSDSDGGSTTISDPRDYDDEPEWMRKFDLAKSIKSNSDAGTAVSETRSKSQNSNPTDWMKKFIQAKEERSMTTTSLPTTLNDEKDSDWMKKFEKAKDEQSSTNSTVSTNTPLPTRENTPLLTKENEKGSDWPKVEDDQSSTKENNKNRDWLQKFEKVKEKETSTNVSLLTDDLDLGESDGVGEKNSKSLDLSAAPNPTQTLESLPTSVDEAKKTKIKPSEPKQYKKPANVDKAERRERIRRNLEKLRRRERIRKNLGTLQAKMKKEQPEGKEESENKEQRENDIPTMSSRMRKYERAIFKGMEKTAPSYDRNNRGAPMTSITTNQPVTKKNAAPKTNKQNSWSITKKPNYNPPTTERNRWFSPLNNTYFGGKQETPAKPKFADRNKQQKSEGTKQKVGNVVIGTQSTSEKEAIEVPSIKSKMNALNQAIDQSNVNENKYYQQSPRQKLTDTSKHRQNEFVKQNIPATAESAKSPVQKEVVKVPSIESKMNALSQALYKSNGNADKSYQQNPIRKLVDTSKHRKNEFVKQSASNFVRTTPTQSRKEGIKLSSIESKMNALSQALYKSNAYENKSYQTSPQQKNLNTKKNQVNRLSEQSASNFVRTTPTPSQKEDIKVPSSMESKRNALNQALFKNSASQNISYQISPQQKSLDTKKNQINRFSEQNPANVVKTSPNPSQKEVIKVTSSIESKKNALNEALFKNNVNQNASIAKNAKKAGADESRNVISDSATPSRKAPSPKVTHRKTEPHRSTTPSPKVTHRKTESSSTKSVPEKEIAESKSHETRAEIESCVPENLFGMWGETVKAKKPVTDSPVYSHGDAKKQANKIKERIEKAKRDAVDASGGQKRNEDEANSGRKENIDVDSSASEDAAALFYAAGSKNSDGEEYEYEEIEYFSGESEGGAFSDGDLAGKNTMDDDAAALFYAAGCGRGNVGVDAAELEYDIEEYEEEVLEDSTESEMDETMDDYIGAAAVVGVGTAPGILKMESKKDEESSVEYDESEMADTMDEYPSPAKNVQKNRLDKFESKADDKDYDETSVDYDESEMADTMDENPSPAKNLAKNRLDQVGSKRDEASSVDIDESEMADTMDEYPSPAKNTEKNRLDKSGSKKDESERDLDATMNSGILSPFPTNKPRSYRNKNKLNAKKSNKDIQPSIGGITPFYGSSLGKYKNAPDSSSSSSNRLNDDVPLDRNTSIKSMLDDSFSSSSFPDTPEKELRKTSLKNEARELEKISKHEVETEDTRQRKKDEENEFRDNSSKYATSKYNIPHSYADPTFDDDSSFFASDFSETSFRNLRPREVEKKAKRSEVEKKDKKQKKQKPKKMKSKKKLKSKKKDKKI